jgi:hypothetical protein
MDPLQRTGEKEIEARKATVKSDKAIPLSQVRDVSLLQAVQKESRFQ